MVLHYKFSTKVLLPAVRIYFLLTIVILDKLSEIIYLKQKRCQKQIENPIELSY